MSRKKHDPVKAELARAIAALLGDRDLTVPAAAELLGLDEPTLSDLLKGRLRAFSEARLLDFLVRLGQDVHIVINEKPLHRESGEIAVLLIRSLKRSRHQVSEPAIRRDPVPWDALTPGQKKAYAAVLREQARETKAPVMSEEDAELLLLHLAPVDRVH